MFVTSKRLSLFSAHGPYRVQEGLKKKENRSVFDENTFFESGTKFKCFQIFLMFWVQNVFGLKTAKSFQCARPL